MTDSRECCVDPGAACGCCEGIEPITPRATANRPGLSALSYRIGTHATFLESMEARLSTHALIDPEKGADGQVSRPLASLTTRDQSDPSIALLDAWAMVGDLLTFYQERIANEGYLRTATERASVLELARLVGYKPRPGVTASTYLAYTIDEKTTEEVLIPAGARVQSVPGPDELPQSFETSENLAARASWNKLMPRKTQPLRWITNEPPGKLYLKGISTNLKPNDPLLIDTDDGGDPQLYRVTAVVADGEADRTEVAIESWSGAGAAGTLVELASAATSRLIASPFRRKPSGVLAELDTVRSLAADAADAAGTEKLFLHIDQTTLPLLRKTLRSAGSRAHALRKWLAEASMALEELRDAAGRAEVGRAAAEVTASPFSARLNTLITKPSQPLANALQLPRELESSFRPTSDAGLKALGLASPDLKESLGAAVATYAKASPANTVAVYALRLKAGVFGRNAQKRQKMVRSDDGMEQATIGEWPIVDNDGESETESTGTVFLDNYYDGILPGSWLVLDSAGVPVYNAGAASVEPVVFPEDRKEGVPGFQKYLIARAKSVAKVTRAEYGMSGDSVRVGLDKDWLRFTVPKGDGNNGEQARINRDFKVIRGTAVYTQSELLELAEAPIETPVCDGSSESEPLELNGLYLDLEPGRFVIVSGERTDIADTTGVLAAEAAMITEVVHDVRRADAAVPFGAAETKMKGGKVESAALAGDRNHTFIRLDKSLSYCYRRDTIKIYGNVVKATHGETRNETLGGGDGAKALQSFTLKQAPLTYLAAATAVGAESTLQVFVSDVRWNEEDSFVGVAAGDHAFVTRTDDNDRTTLTFGNGREGARLPSGTENVKAIYRYSIGKAGNVRAEQLTQLSTRPLGVKEVINPIRASGGADRESLDQARRSAPLAVMSLDRLVSTPDYADFARSFAGIGKADAVELSDGRRTVVHVTIAGTDDVPIDTGSDLYINLRRALVELGDPFQPVQLVTRELLILVISAGVRIDPDYLWEDVVTNVRNRLLETFGFERRELARDVAGSEAISAIQSVRGVVYVDLDVFGALPSTIADPGAEEGRRPLTPEETANEMLLIVGRPPATRVIAEPARIDKTGILPAQLAMLVPELPDTLILNQIND